MSRAADFTTRPGASKEQTEVEAFPGVIRTGPGPSVSDAARWIPSIPSQARSLEGFLNALDGLCSSPHLRQLPGLPFDRAGQTHELPRYEFTGPKGGGDAVRLGLFALIHGDEPQSGVGLLCFLQSLAENPGLAEGFTIHAYPLCNPTGYCDRTRHARGGKDLNREFWRNSPEPEVQRLEEEIRRHRFHGILSLHCDDTSHGLYGFLSGRSASAVLSESLLEPALRAAEEFLPRNFDSQIDGFHARGGVLSTCYDGVLRAPDDANPPPFEITFETPQHAAAARQAEAFNAALLSILAEYRQLLAHAPNL